MNICRIVLYENKLLWHITTAMVCFFLVLALLMILWLFYKSKKLSLFLMLKLIELSKCLLISIIIFRTFILHYAFIIWCVTYILIGFFEINSRKIRYINYSIREKKCVKKAYKHIHTTDNKNFFNCIVDNVFLLHQNSYLKNVIINRKECAWKKSFLPANYFVIGLICPSLNLVIMGSQYGKSDVLFLKLFEINILIFVLLCILYPIAYFFSVKLETGKMFQSKFWFNIGYILFSFLIFFTLNGIVILSN